VTSSGTLVVSLVGPSKVVVGTVQSFGFTDTLSVSLDPLGVAVNPAGTLAYVALVNSQKLGTIDLGTKAVAYAPFVPADAQVLSVLASSDGQYVFVGTGSWLYKLSATTLTTLDSTPASFALHLAAHPTLPRIYASMQGTGYVQEIDIATMDSLRSFGPGSTIQAVDVAPDGSTLYVANEGAGKVTSFDLATGNPGSSITTAGGAFGLVVGGSVLYVTCPQSGDVEAFDRGSGVRLYHKQNMGQPRRPALGPGGILVVPNENGTVDFIQ
jgi:DNA-binding beta-propeller fold protein YncE